MSPLAARRAQRTGQKATSAPVGGLRRCLLGGSERMRTVGVGSRACPSLSRGVCRALRSRFEKVGFRDSESAFPVYIGASGALKKSNPGSCGG